MEKNGYNKTTKKTSCPLRAGFEPTRENPIDFKSNALNTRPSQLNELRERRKT